MPSDPVFAISKIIQRKKSENELQLLIKQKGMPVDEVFLKQDISFVLESLSQLMISPMTAQLVFKVIGVDTEGTSNAREQ